MTVSILSGLLLYTAADTLREPTLFEFLEHQALSSGLAIIILELKTKNGK